MMLMARLKSCPFEIVVLISLCDSIGKQQVLRCAQNDNKKTKATAKAKTTTEADSLRE
jgi:hypothetical protein